MVVVVVVGSSPPLIFVTTFVSTPLKPVVSQTKAKKKGTAILKTKKKGIVFNFSGERQREMAAEVVVVVVVMTALMDVVVTVGMQSVSSSPGRLILVTHYLPPFHLHLHTFHRVKL